MTSQGGYQEKAGAVELGGSAQAAPAQFTVGAVGFVPTWTMEDSMAASIVRLECEKEELIARVAVLEEEQKILKATIESLRDALCSYKCADKAAADGGWANI
ncbi:MAG: hypothetical protein ACO3L2_11375, partial [Chthoniobacterales bacterium]